MVFLQHLVLRIFELTTEGTTFGGNLERDFSDHWLAGIYQSMLLNLAFKVLNLCLETENITGDYGSA